jgi:DNA-directed RNA polymerase specialized sigma24 family protein
MTGTGVVALTMNPFKKTSWELNQEGFDQLLVWLSPNRDEAGKKYEDIRRRLIKIFTCRGCPIPEELADETINRVTRKVPQISDHYVGDPCLYFYGVAKYVFHEYVRKKPVLDPPPVSDPTEDDEEVVACMEDCLQELAPKSRELILNYYQEERHAKIAERKRLAERLGMGPNALRIQACRIRGSLYKCVQECLNRPNTL